MPITRSWQWALDDREADAEKARVAAETRSRGLTPCDACGAPAVVYVDCHHARFNSFRCERDVLGVVNHFAITGRHPVTVGPLVSTGGHHTSDRRYFASEADAKAHQRMLDERADAERRRRTAHIPRTTENDSRPRVQGSAVIDVLDGRGVPLPEFSDSREEPNGPEPIITTTREDRTS